MNTDRKLSVLACVGAYLPAYKYGGPVRSLVNLVEALADSVNFQVLTRDRDLGDSDPFPGIDSGRWLPVGPARVCYLANGAGSLPEVRRAIKMTAYDVLYLNSCFDTPLAVFPLLLRRFGDLRQPTIIAPRGALSRQGLTKRSTKKKAYLLCAKLSGLFRKVLWQATSEAEADDIRREIGDGANVWLAPNLPSNPERLIEGLPPRPVKQRGGLRLVYAGRISREKNLLGALDVLGMVSGDITLSIYGYIDEEDYWRECEAAIAKLPGNIRVVYRGAARHEEMPRIFREHDMMLSASWSENFGHGIIEAMSVGCPVLIGDKTPWRQLASARAGWDVPLDEPGAMSAVLAEAVRLDDDEFRHLSGGAIAYAQSVFSGNRTVDMNRRLFWTAMNGI